MNEWKEYTLESIIDKFIDYRGKTPKKSNSGIPLVTAKVVKDGKILTPNEFIPVEDYKKWMTRGFPKRNDVILTTEAPLGEVALIKDENIALAQRIITMRGNPNLVSNAFLKYYLQSDQGQYELASRASGTTVFGIKASILRGLPVWLPPLPEQRAIASVLSSLDDKIDLLHRQNETLEQMAETLFRQWFLPAGRQGVEEAAKPIEVGVISDLIDFNPSRKVSKGQNAPYLEMAELNTSTYAPSSWYYREFSSGSKFKNGDALLARITPCLENGKAAYIDFLEEEEIGWGSTEFIVMRAKRNLHPFFSYIITRNDDFKDFAESCMQGSSGRQRVDIDNLKSYEIAIPSPNVIERFNNFCHSIVPKLKSNQDQIRTLTALRDTLLPKLMNGEVRVKRNPVETDGRPSLPGRLSLRES